MKVEEIMTRDVIIAESDDLLQNAARMMARLDAGMLPILENDRLVGVITDRDITVRAVAENKAPASTKVKSVMTPGVRYCFEDEDVDAVAAHMAEWKVRRLVVLSRNNELVGIVSLGDLTGERRPEVGAHALRGNSRQGETELSQP